MLREIFALKDIRVTRIVVDSRRRMTVDGAAVMFPMTMTLISLCNDEERNNNIKHSK
jgi:hypothetical protein